MNMQKQILSELQQIRNILSHIVGSTEQSSEDRFCKEALDKAAKSFKRMEIERGAWVKENDIGKYIKSDWTAGKFIRAEFGFTACIKDGYYYLYNKKALEKLGQELKARNIDLNRY